MLICSFVVSRSRVLLAAFRSPRASGPTGVWEWRVGKPDALLVDALHTEGLSASCYCQAVRGSCRGYHAQREEADLAESPVPQMLTVNESGTPAGGCRQAARFL